MTRWPCLAHGDEDVDKLWREKFRTASAFEKATRETLLDVLGRGLAALRLIREVSTGSCSKDTCQPMSARLGCSSTYWACASSHCTLIEFGLVSLAAAPTCSSQGMPWLGVNNESGCNLLQPPIIAAVFEHGSYRLLTCCLQLIPSSRSVTARLQPALVMNLLAGGANADGLGNRFALNFPPRVDRNLDELRFCFLCSWPL